MPAPVQVMGHKPDTTFKLFDKKKNDGEKVEANATIMIEVDITV